MRYTPYDSPAGLRSFLSADPHKTGVAMKLFRLVVFAFAAIHLSSAPAQEATPAPASTAPDPSATLAYIHGAWNTLTRSMTDCHSLVDIKITANPVLYLPAEISPPADVTALEGPGEAAHHHHGARKLVRWRPMDGRPAGSRRDPYALSYGPRRAH